MVIFIAFAGWLTFFDHHRYGTHGDGFECGGVKDTVTSYTATSYYLFSQSYNEDEIRVGTCPYDKFKARTYGLEVWILATILGYASYKSFKSDQMSETK
jgi:hypothetical protein